MSITNCPTILYQLDLSFLHSTPKGTAMNNDLATIFGGNPFDPSTVEPQTDFQVIPPGKYPVLIEEAEVKQTKAGTGHYIKLTMSVLDGPYKNRKLWDQINVQNPSAQCVEIGLRTLSALGRAIGTGPITDTAQLVNQVVIAHVKVKNDQNEVRTYSSTAAAPSMPVTQPGPPVGYVAAPAPLPATPAASSTQAPAAQGKPPWVK